MRTRQEAYSEALRKTKKQVGQMMANNRIEDEVRRVRVANKFILEIDCIRNDGIMAGKRGEALSFEIYAVLNGRETDSITIDVTLHDDINPIIDKEVGYLLDCYLKED